MRLNYQEQTSSLQDFNTITHPSRYMSLQIPYYNTYTFSPHNNTLHNTYNTTRTHQGSKVH